MTRYTNLAKRKVCKEGATSWAALKAQRTKEERGAAVNAATDPAEVEDEAGAAPSAAEAEAASAAPADQRPGQDAALWPVTEKGIGRKREHEKVKLDVYRKGQSADALEGERSAVAAPRESRPIAARSTLASALGRKKTAHEPGKSTKRKRAAKVVTF
eukprot:CAMPEP_0206323800 /NCGR_PEP_ID=MMETSP0106_2-20121207/20175_1 /ASSEMBLY_ACC=CAM_ASM_000206 /TAXON_ID=81532 /ORGANISM="Acanthoeca-like sp., Strain 10tr" /LENGTH=157 /DNA_ID=CAMNT_0053756109 /DNA_START=46 /DNA_END=520 /DNA_ORIENTATION=-